MISDYGYRDAVDFAQYPELQGANWRKYVADLDNVAKVILADLTEAEAEKGSDATPYIYDDVLQALSYRHE
eukprot:2433671-Rhodomonas_salina.1